MRPVRERGQLGALSDLTTSTVGHGAHLRTRPVAGSSCTARVRRRVSMGRGGTKGGGRVGVRHGRAALLDALLSKDVARAKEEAWVRRG